MRLFTAGPLLLIASQLALAPAEKAKAYTEYSISNFGETEYNTGGTIVGNKRIFTWGADMGGKPLQLRYTEVQESPTSFTYQAEASIDGGPWTLIADGRVTKVQ